MPSFNSAWGLWHWENAVFKYTSSAAQLGFSTWENNLLRQSVSKVKQHGCPASDKKPKKPKKKPVQIRYPKAGISLRVTAHSSGRQTEEIL